MAKTVSTPIFYETLAAAAHCTPADALEHLAAIEDRDHGFGRQAVTVFLTEYAA
jgi:hypothetical protein